MRLHIDCLVVVDMAMAGLALSQGYIAVLIHSSHLPKTADFPKNWVRDKDATPLSQTP